VVQGVWGGITSAWNDITHGVDCLFDPSNPRCLPQSANNDGVKMDFSNLCNEYLSHPATVTAPMDAMTTDFEPLPTATPVQTYTPILSTSVDNYGTPTPTPEPSNTYVQTYAPTSVLMPASNLLTTTRPTRSINPSRTLTSSVVVPGSAIGSYGLSTPTLLMTYMIFLMLSLFVL